MADVLVVVGVGGMGEAIARRSGSGRKVLLADFNESLLASTAERLGGDGFDIATHAVDVSSRDSVRSLSAAAARLGSVTRLAHTAGLSPVQAPATAVLRVDLAGVAYVLEDFAEVVAPGGAGVVIASMAGALASGQFDAQAEGLLRSTPSEELLSLPLVQQVAAGGNAAAAYSLAKRANQLRVQAASRPWGERGARVNSVSPGIIATPMGQQELAGPTGALMRSMISASATRRQGTSTDISAAVEFLLGPDATFITGTDLLVDGGVVAALSSGAPLG